MFGFRNRGLAAQLAHEKKRVDIALEGYEIVMEKYEAQSRAFDGAKLANLEMAQDILKLSHEGAAMRALIQKCVAALTEVSDLTSSPSHFAALIKEGHRLLRGELKVLSQ